METKNEDLNKTLTPEEFIRLANNFYTNKGLQTGLDRIALDSHLYNYVSENAIKVKQTQYKVALCFICVNPPYWEFAQPVIEGARKFFLPGHQTDIFLWSDMPKTENGENPYDTKFYPLEPIEWPMPTLLRYHTLIQAEEELANYDYVFYLDIDMRFQNVVGDEILGDDLTACLHPMYALRKQLWPPYEPNKDSSAYIKRPGVVIQDEGKQRFMPTYFAGGFLGGKTQPFLKMCKEIRKLVDADLAKNYIAIWNDESYLNKYLEDKVPSVILTASYIYPDSLIKEYYEPIWGCSYIPKIITLTKKFTVSKEGGEAAAKMVSELNSLK